MRRDRTFCAWTTLSSRSKTARRPEAAGGEGTPGTQKLRDELRRWEKVLFARKYRQLAETIESARARLAPRRESLASGQLCATVENDLGRLRIEMAKAETRATTARELAHARELAINRQQQQIVFDRKQVTSLDERGAAVASEIAMIEARRDPARVALAGRRQAALDAEAERERAAARLTGNRKPTRPGHREMSGLESDVEAARSGSLFRPSTRRPRSDMRSKMPPRRAMG